MRQNKQTSPWSQSPGCSASNILKPLAGAGADRKEDRHRDLYFRSSGTRCNESGSSCRTESLTSRRRGRLQSSPLAHLVLPEGRVFFSRSMKDQTSERSLRGGQEVRRHKRGHGPSKPTPVPQPRGSLFLKTKPAPPHLILGGSSRSAQTSLTQEM